MTVYYYPFYRSFVCFVGIVHLFHLEIKAAQVSKAVQIGEM